MCLNWCTFLLPLNKICKIKSKKKEIKTKQLVLSPEYTQIKTKKTKTRNFYLRFYHFFAVLAPSLSSTNDRFVMLVL